MFFAEPNRRLFLVSVWVLVVFPSPSASAAVNQLMNEKCNGGRVKDKNGECICPPGYFGDKNSLPSCEREDFSNDKPVQLEIEDTSMNPVMVTSLKPDTEYTRSVSGFTSNGYGKSRTLADGKTVANIQNPAAHVQWWIILLICFFLIIVIIVKFIVPCLRKFNICCRYRHTYHINEENEGLNDPVDLEGTENVENANRQKNSRWNLLHVRRLLFGFRELKTEDIEMTNCHTYNGSDSNPQMRPLDESDSNSRNGQELVAKYWNGRQDVLDRVALRGPEGNELRSLENLPQLNESNATNLNNGANLSSNEEESSNDQTSAVRDERMNNFILKTNGNVLTNTNDLAIDIGQNSIATVKSIEVEENEHQFPEIQVYGN